MGIVTPFRNTGLKQTNKKQDNGSSFKKRLRKPGNSHLFSGGETEEVKCQTFTQTRIILKASV